MTIEEKVARAIMRQRDIDPDGPATFLGSPYTNLDSYTETARAAIKAIDTEALKVLRELVELVESRGGSVLAFKSETLEQATRAGELVQKARELVK